MPLCSGGCSLLLSCVIFLCVFFFGRITDNRLCIRIRVSDLASQFPDLPGLGLAGYECRQFPDGSNPLDNIVCSLLLVAIMLPIKLVIMRMMELANEAEYPDQARQRTDISSGRNCCASASSAASDNISCCFLFLGCW